MPEWSGVQAVPRETKTEVQLYQDKSPRGGKIQKIGGQFQSATADSITLKLEDGQLRILQKQDVRKVLTHRPFWKRWPYWYWQGS